MTKYMVMGEISAMSAALRRAMRSSHQNESLEGLIRSFSSTKDILSRQSELSDLEPSIYFSPFLEVIKSEDTSGTVTAMALTAVAKFLQYNLIDHRLESAAATSEQIVLALKKISYITDDAASDEVVIMKFLHVIRSLLLSPVGCLLTNSGVCELIQAIIKIIFDPGFGLLVKKIAEQTWGEVVQLMFARLPMFREDAQDDLQLKQLRIRGNGATNIEHRHSQRRRAGHGRPRKMKTQEEMPFSIGSTRDKEPGSGGGSISSRHEHNRGETAGTTHLIATDEHVPKPEVGGKESEDDDDNDDVEAAVRHSGEPLPSEYDAATMSAQQGAAASVRGDRRDPSLPDEVLSTGEVQHSQPPPVQSVVQLQREEERTSSEDSVAETNLNSSNESSPAPAPPTVTEHAKATLNGEVRRGASGDDADEAAENTGRLSESVEIVSGESIDEGSRIMHLCGSVNSLDEIGHHPDEGSGVGVSGQETGPREPATGDKDFVSSRGVRFTPGGDRVPYGLSSVRELLKFISIIICPQEPYNNSEQIILLGLELMTIALEVGGRHIGSFPSLVELVKDDVSKNLLALLKSQRIGILVSTTRVCFLLFESLRSQLKFQLESYLLKLTELITYEGPNKINYEIKELAIDNIVSLWRIPGFVTELYLNYDCDLYCSNLFEDLTQTLSKTAFPVTAIYSVHNLSLEALLAVIDSVETHCHFMMVSSKDHENREPAAASSAANKPSEAMHPAQASGQLIQQPVALSDLQLRTFAPATGGIANTAGYNSFTPSALPPPPPPPPPPLRNSSDAVPGGSVDRDDILIIPPHERVVAIRHKKRLLQQGTEHFNQKPSNGVEFLMENDILPKPFSPEKVAEFLRTNYQLDKNKIGDYISNRKNVDLLKAFVKSFNFTDTRIDEALRMYLETFRLPGEAQPISQILEHFAEHWHTSNGEPFASPDAAFTLAYAIIMLNVDQHNHNVKKQSTPMTEEDFIKNLKGVNGGADFERRLLSDIYDSIRTDEIVMPAEQTGIVRENYLWKVLLKRGASSEGRFTECSGIGGGVLDDEVFSLAWSPTLVALSYLLDKVVDDSLLTHKLMAGYRKCATIAAHYGRTEVFDHLIKALYKYTGISSADPVLGVLQALGGDQRAQLTAKTMFTLANKHGDVMREGWRQLVDYTLILYRAGLMPASVTTAGEVEPERSVSIARSRPKPDRAEQSGGGGLLSSLVSYITSSEGPAQREHEAKLRAVAKTCVLNFHPEFIFSESTFLRTSALEELVRVLIASCPAPPSSSSPSLAVSSAASRRPAPGLDLVGGGSYDEESVIFALELLVKVVLKNKDRVHRIWEPVRDHLVALVIGAAAASEYRRLLERAVVAMLRLALRLCNGDQMGSQALQNLAMLLLLKPAAVKAVARQIVYAVHTLFGTSASCLTSRADWQILFALLSVAGAGLKPSSQALMLDSELVAKMAAKCAELKNSDSQSFDSGVQSDSEMGSLRRSTSAVLEPDRGYTSDSEVSTRTPKHYLHHNNNNNNSCASSITSNNNNSNSSSNIDNAAGRGSHNAHNNGSHDNKRHFSTNIAGSWILVGQEDGGSPVRAGAGGAYSVNQYSISLPWCELTPHDPFAMTEAAHCLTQLVKESGKGPSHAKGRGVNGVDDRNVESCIRCLRVFVEASLHSRGKRHRAAKGSTRAPAKAARSASPTSESDSDGGEGPAAPPGYPFIAVELLNAMYLLHTSWSQISHRSSEDVSKESGGSGEEDRDDRNDSSEHWTRCWCPLLQGMARLCCDTRKQVRSLALGYLQSALLAKYLQTLKAEQWEACFHQVLFPLLQALLEGQVFSDVAVAEETLVRVNTLLSKVFLQHLSPLLTLPTFTALWLTVLDFMDKFMRLDQAGDLLDAIPESLKNMLLVMDTAGVFRTTKPDGTTVPSELWNVTWDRVAPFLPGLQNELFKKPEQPVVSKQVPDYAEEQQQRHSGSEVAAQPNAASTPASASNAEDLESELPPVVSLEEALRAPRRIPLSIGGILLQETPLMPSNNYVATYARNGVNSTLVEPPPLQQLEQQKQAYSQQQQQLVYNNNHYGSVIQQQQVGLTQQYSQQDSCPTQTQQLQQQQQQQQQQHPSQQSSQAVAVAQTLPQQSSVGHNVAMVSPISSMPSSPQHASSAVQPTPAQQSLDRRLSYEQIQLHHQQYQQFYYQQQAQQQQQQHQQQQQQQQQQHQQQQQQQPQQQQQQHQQQQQQQQLPHQQHHQQQQQQQQLPHQQHHNQTPPQFIYHSAQQQQQQQRLMAPSNVAGVAGSLGSSGNGSCTAVTGVSTSSSSSIPVYPGQAVGQNHTAAAAAAASVTPVGQSVLPQQLPLFYSTGVATPQAVPASHMSGQLQGQFYLTGQQQPPPTAERY